MEPCKCHVNCHVNFHANLHGSITKKKILHEFLHITFLFAVDGCTCAHCNSFGKWGF
jgi:hypothetical protein